MFNRLHAPLIVVVLALLMLGAAPAFAKASDKDKDDLKERSLCIFDPIGASGFIYQNLRPYIIQAMEWGVDFDPRAYTSQSVAVSDFKAGRCDAVVITGVRARYFVKFSGSLDMVGGLQTYDQLRKAIRIMSSPEASKYMEQDGFEVAGVLPLGKVYLYARDRSMLQSLDHLAGKKVAVMSYDKQAKVLARVAGAVPVPASIATIGPMFNNGAVDLIYAPSFAYQALELYKGLGKDGGVLEFVLGMLTAQIVLHDKRFSEEFAQNSRTWVFKHLFDRFVQRAKQADKRIPDKYWVEVSGERERKYRSMILKVRQRLWEAHWYSHKMQHMLKKIRCTTNPGLAECTRPTEGGAIY